MKKKNRYVHQLVKMSRQTWKLYQIFENLENQPQKDFKEYLTYWQLLQMIPEYDREAKKERLLHYIERVEVLEYSLENAQYLKRILHVFH